MKHDLIIIGGGASGIISAITAKDMGINVAIIEGNDRIGKKILATGNGRCNISNKNIDMKRYHSENSNFFEFVLKSFTVSNTKNFFYNLGLPLIMLEDGKMFPMSLQSSSVIDILRLALKDRNIPVYLNSKVKDINYDKNKFNIFTINQKCFNCNKLIIATGGKSSPKTGSEGSGYALARSLGHNIIPPLPALVQLKLDYNHLKALSGVKFDGTVEIFVEGVSKRKEIGEILFTNYGISGPPILQISRIASCNLYSKKNVNISIDMIPNINKEELEILLENHWGYFSYRSVHNSLIGIINKKIIPILLKEAKVSNIHKPCSDLEWYEKKNIINLLKNWTFNVIDTNSFNDAQITVGGIDTKEINPKTLESKIIKNLYFAGEVMDVDGDCGGFNLQWAWSSGFIAAKNATTK